MDLSRDSIGAFNYNKGCLGDPAKQANTGCTRIGRESNLSRIGEKSVNKLKRTHTSGGEVHTFVYFHYAASLIHGRCPSNGIRLVTLWDIIVHRQMYLGSLTFAGVKYLLPGNNSTFRHKDTCRFIKY